MKDPSARMRFGIADFLARYDPVAGDIRGGSGPFRFERVLEKAHERAEESRWCDESSSWWAFSRQAAFAALR